MVKVSIIIITFNEEKNIADCLNSLSKQEFKDFEIIIVDHSQDNTKQIIQNFKSIFNKIRYIPIDTPSFAKQRNVGIKAAKGKHIAFIDADCIAPKDWLSKLMNSFASDIIGIGGNAYSPPNSPYLGKMIACLGFPAGGDIGLDSNTKINGRYTQGMATCNALFLRNKLDEINGFDSTLQYGGEDSDLCKRLIKKGYKLGYNKTSFVYHKTRDSLKSYIEWNLRRGIADFHINQKSLLNYIFNPFSLISLMLYLEFLMILFLFNPKLSILLLIITYFLFNLITIVFIRKFRLLFKRRTKIGISIASTFIIIPFLFYLRKFLINLQGLKLKLNNGI